MSNLSSVQFAATDANSANSTEYSDDYLSSTLPFLITLFLLIVATLLSNSFVFFAVYSFRELRTVTNSFVISLASADVSVALLAMPAWMVTNVIQHRPGTYEAYAFDLGTRWIDIFCCSASIFNATLVSFDRYLAINKPLHYRVVVTKYRAYKAIAATWGAAMIVTAISFIQYRDNASTYGWAIFMFITILCIPLSVMGFAYFSIYQAAIAQLTKMASMRLSTPLGRANSVNKAASANARRKRFYQELRITKTLALIVSLFVVAWAPYLVMVMVETFDLTVVVPRPLSDIILWLPHINSCVNPWIYTGINKDFRKAFKTLFCGSDGICNYWQRQRGIGQRQSSFSAEDSTLVRRSRTVPTTSSTENAREWNCTSI